MFLFFICFSGIAVACVDFWTCHTFSLETFRWKRTLHEGISNGSHTHARTHIFRFWDACVLVKWGIMHGFCAFAYMAAFTVYCVLCTETAPACQHTVGVCLIQFNFFFCCPSLGRVRLKWRIGCRLYSITEYVFHFTRFYLLFFSFRLFSFSIFRVCVECWRNFRSNTT